MRLQDVSGRPIRFHTEPQIDDSTGVFCFLISRRGWLIDLRPATTDNTLPREKIDALTDGGGLRLAVLRSGSETWHFKYQLGGEREKVTICAYPAFTLKQARSCHQELRALVDRRQSPAKVKRVLARGRARPAV